MGIREELADIIASRRGVTAKTNDTDRLVADKILARFAVVELPAHAYEDENGATWINDATGATYVTVANGMVRTFGEELTSDEAWHYAVALLAAATYAEENA